MFVKFFSGESDVFVKFFSGESDVFVNGKLPEITTCLWKTPYWRHCRFPALYSQVAAHAPMALHHRAPYRYLPTLSLSVSIRLVWIVPGRVWAASFRVGWSCFRCAGATPSPDRYAWPCGHPSRYCLSRPDSFKSVRPTLHSISVPRCPVFPGFGEGKTGHRKRRKLMAQTFTPRTTGLSEATLCNAGGQTNDFPQ